VQQSEGVAGMRCIALLHKMSLICARGAHIPTTPAARVPRAAAPLTQGGSRSQVDVDAGLKEFRK